MAQPGRLGVLVHWRSVYDKSFYDTINQGSMKSAKAIVPRVMDIVKPQTVLDVGCGEGVWLAEFERHGVYTTGLDGSYVERYAPKGEFIPTDLNQPFQVDAQYDLTICLEVAEHLEPDRARSFVEDLTETSETILFSAAIPMQGGVGHVNEQWPAYWVEMFEAFGYTANGALRFEFWDDPDVENWYKANMILFHMGEILLPPSRPIAVVHPVLWAYHKGCEYP